MITALLLLLPVAGIAVSSEILWRNKVLRGEGGRKYIHILSGLWIACWPFWLSLREIQVVAFFLTLGLVFLHFVPIFHAVRDVRRKTVGDILYPLAISVSAGLAREPWMFSLAMLFLALADGLAAVFGTRYAAYTRAYYVFGFKKTVLGTSVYFITALCSCLLVLMLYPEATVHQNVAFVLVGLSAVSTLLENALPYGADNVLIPALVTWMLSR